MPDTLSPEAVASVSTSPANRNRKNGVLVRFTDNELEALHKRVEASGHSQQEFLLHAALFNEVSANDTKELRQLITALNLIFVELRRQGINLNQIAHDMNAYKSDYDFNDDQDLQLALIENQSMKEEVKELCQQLKTLSAKRMATKQSML